MFMYMYMSYRIENICGLYWTGEWDEVDRKGFAMGIFPQHMGEIIKKNVLAASELRKHGSRVDVYLCLRLHSYTQLGYCELK
jgi:hypothetical protein